MDGKAIDEFDLLDLRRLIALVSQEVYLFHGTIRENISYGNEQATFDALTKAYAMSTENMKSRMEELTGGLNLNLPGTEFTD